MAGNLLAVRAVQGDCQWPLKNDGNSHKSPEPMMRCNFNDSMELSTPQSIMIATNHTVATRLERLFRSRWRTASALTGHVTPKRIQYSFSYWHRCCWEGNGFRVLLYLLRTFCVALNMWNPLTSWWNQEILSLSTPLGNTLLIFNTYVNKCVNFW